VTASSPRVVVVGGGITGLAAAHRLTRHVPGSQITLVEVDDRLGGKIVTERGDGFVIEGGPDSFLATKPRGVGLSKEVGLGERLIEVTPRERRAFVLFRGELHDLPEGLTGLVPTRLAPLARSPLLSPAGKARVALDYVLPARRDAGDESLGGFIRRRLGTEAWERLVEPLMAGIYAADGDTLSLAATFPQLREAERTHGGLIRGVLAARRAAPAVAPRSPFLTPAAGLGELVAALERELWGAGVEIATGVGVATLAPTDAGYHVALATGDGMTADAVILTTPAFVSAGLVAPFSPALAHDLAEIPHASTAIVTLGWRSAEIPHPLEGHGYVVPRVAGGPILACTWSSRKWRGRAPAGWEVIRVFVGRAGHEEMIDADDDALIALAWREATERLGVTAPPALTRVHRWPRGMPQYVLGHPQRVARIEAAAATHPGLFLAGNAYRGVGIPDCIASGERAAEAAAAVIRGQNAGLMVTV
jgi:oxygen-dependent protoporphyrinogen oxidase